MVRAHDWSRTPLGSRHIWPQSLKTAVGLVLASPSPMILLWGSELVQIYNEGYRDIMGAKHPGGLGQRNRECWGEVWEFTGPIYDGVMRGESFTFEHQRLVLERHGYPEETFFTLAYSPVPDESGGIGGILVSVFETTEKARQVREERIAVLEEVFRTTPSFLHVLQGPQFIFEFANEAYYQLVGRRDLIGRPAFEALPEAAGGGFQERLAQVMTTGEPFFGRELPVKLARTPGAPPEERIIDLIYLPLIDPDGRCSRVVGHGTDVTDYVRSRAEAEAALRESEVRQAAAVLREEEAREAEEALRQGEHRLRQRVAEFETLLNVLPVGIGVALDRECRTVRTNPAFARMLRLGEGQNASLTAPEEERPTHFRCLDRAGLEVPNEQLPMQIAARDGQPSEGLEFQIVHADGETLRLLEYAAPLFDERGEPRGSVGAFVDVTERERSAAALRQSEERYRALFESMDEGYCIIEVLFDPANASRAVDYRFVEINPAFEGQSGMRGVVGRRMLEFVPSIEPHWLENYGRVALTGEPVRFANEYKGLHRWFEVYAFRVDAAKRHVAVLFTDITARQKVELALRESEERYRTLFDTIDEGFCVIEFLDGPHGPLSDYAHVEANPAYERHAGIPDVVGQRVREMVPEEANDWIELYRQVLLTGEPIRFERELIATKRHLELFAFRVEPASRRQVALLFQDITARRQGEDALRESEVRFRQIADTMPHMIWVTLPDGYHEWYNRRWYEFTGVPEGSTDGEAWNGMFHPDDQQRAWTHWRHSLATGDPYEIEYRLRHHSGEYRWVLGRALPIRDAEGSIERWFGTCTDIDAMKSAEEALKRADRQKDEFLAMLAHELRNPLAPILSATAILKARGGSDPVTQRQREVIERQAQHMARLVADLLDVSRLQRGTYALEREPLDLVQIVRDCVDDYRGTVEGQGLELVANVPATPLPVDGDRVRLGQALGNLLSNAAKFTPGDGRVVVDLRAVEAGGGGQAVLSVRDSGVGIPQEALSTIWEIFVQGKQDLARSKGGLGLGLGLVKGIVEMHGGSVSATSAGEGFGAEFTLTLPILSGQPRPAAETWSDVAGRDGSGQKILLIEDNRDAGETLQALLELHGYEVQLVFNGRDGLDAAGRWKPSVVLCDLGLPGLSGHEVAEALRQDPTMQGLRLIAISGYVQPADLARSHAAGFDHHVGKPVELNRLLRFLFGCVSLLFVVAGAPAVGLACSPPHGWSDDGVTNAPI